MCDIFGGADKAAKAQEKAAKIASQTQLDMFEQTKKLLAPYVNWGVEGIDALKSRMGELTSSFNPTMEQLEKTPGYQFALQQGLKSTQNSYAAKGLGVSGAAIKGGADYATGLASQTYQQQFQNDLAQKAQQFNMLLNPVQIGAGAASGQGQLGTQVANNLSSIQTHLGDAQANAYQNQSNMFGNLFGDVLGFASKGLFGL